jgi:hypothetical protein
MINVKLEKYLPYAENFSFVGSRAGLYKGTTPMFFPSLPKLLFPSSPVSLDNRSLPRERTKKGKDVDFENFGDYLTTHR